MPTATKKKKKPNKPASNPAADPTIHAINAALQIVGKSEWKEKHVRTNYTWIPKKYKAAVSESHTEVELLVVSPEATGTFTSPGDKDYTNRFSLVMFTIGTPLYVAYALVSVTFGHKLADRPLLVVDTADAKSMTTLAEKLLTLGLRLEV